MYEIWELISKRKTRKTGKDDASRPRIGDGHECGHNCSCGSPCDSSCKVCY